jgi:hypothetical protein
MHTKTIISILALVVTFTVISCDQIKKEKPSVNQFDKTGKMYSIVPKTTTIFWTGYKTTAKTPVKGKFTKLNVSNIKMGKTAREAIDGLEFSIPVSSLFSNEEARDRKIKDFFFGIMNQTELLSGKLSIVNDTLANVNLKMNSISKEFPISYFISGQMLSMQGKLNLDNWNTEKAMKSFHKACKEKHTGEDGISKTWHEVGINVESYLKVE